MIYRGKAKRDKDGFYNINGKKRISVTTLMKSFGIPEPLFYWAGGFGFKEYREELNSLMEVGTTFVGISQVLHRLNSLGLSGAKKKTEVASEYGTEWHKLLENHYFNKKHYINTNIIGAEISQLDELDAYIEKRELEPIDCEFIVYGEDYAGRVDTLFKHKPTGFYVLGDYKTGQKRPFEIACQIGAYCAALPEEYELSDPFVAYIGKNYKKFTPLEYTQEQVADGFVAFDHLLKAYQLKQIIIKNKKQKKEKENESANNQG